MKGEIDEKAFEALLRKRNTPAWATQRIAELEAENARLRAREEWIWSNCKVVHFPGDGTYPIEHNPHAGKDGRFFLEPIITSALANMGGKEGA